MNKNIQIVALRQQAIFIPENELKHSIAENRDIALKTTAKLAKLGYIPTERLLSALLITPENIHSEFIEYIEEVKGVHLNWAPLIKQWDIPTGETIQDHLFTFFANIFDFTKGTVLQCGHLIPDNTFDLNRYNGCPFCGRPFVIEKIELTASDAKLKVLELWTTSDAIAFFADLLTSKTALDATQADSLNQLLSSFPYPQEIEPAMAETRMLVIDFLVANQQAEQAQRFFKTPTDILRYLWYKKTGFLQLVKPKTILKRTALNNKSHFGRPNATDNSGGKAVELKKIEIKLKYNRSFSRIIAKWLNNLSMKPEQICEIMHPNRSLWVRFIRAARLLEFSKRQGFETLKIILDLFHQENYTVWQAQVNRYKQNNEIENALKMLQQRPGVFSRALFSYMLRFDYIKVIQAFEEIIQNVPARLVFTLNMYAQLYFARGGSRVVKPLGGYPKKILPNKLIYSHSVEVVQTMLTSIESLCLKAIKMRFQKENNPNKTIYIEDQLFGMPVAIGDRSETIQDCSAVLQGQKFSLEGETLRLFMHWGKGLQPQNLDMDLYASVYYSNGSMIECFYGYHNIKDQAIYSGDVREIPNELGAVEYIDLNLPKLKEAQANIVVFSCKAYNMPALTMNLVVGWMNNKSPMIIEGTGVAYNPAMVQHMVRISNDISRGMIFGYLDVQNQNVVWLEMPIGDNNSGGLSKESILTFISRLNSKLNIGSLLKIKAEAQNLTIVNTKENADEVYDFRWASNAAAVTKLLVD